MIIRVMGVMNGIIIISSLCLTTIGLFCPSIVFPNAKFSHSS